MGYDEFGQRVNIEYGNGVQTSYKYFDETRRLKSIRTSHGAKGQEVVLQNVSYAYDDVGNILNTINSSFVDLSGDTRSVMQAYAYDDLYRLTDAAGSYMQDRTRFDKYVNHFSYDSINNITLKEQWHYTLNRATGAEQEIKATTYDFDYKYAGERPHAPTTIGDKTYAYDPSGNMASWTDTQNGRMMALTWDARIV